MMFKNFVRLFFQYICCFKILILISIKIFIIINIVLDKNDEDTPARVDCVLLEVKPKLIIFSTVTSDQICFTRIKLTSIAAQNYEYRTILLGLVNLIFAQQNNVNYSSISFLNYIFSTTLRRVQFYGVTQFGHLFIYCICKFR